MADYIDSDEERIERIKQWLLHNGLLILVVIVLAVGGTLGWRSWQDHQTKVAGQASEVYDTMMGALGSDSDDQARSAADKLVSNYGGSAYADYAHLVLAKLAVADGNLDGAAKQLEAVAGAAATKALGYTAQLRLARIYIQQDKLDAAEKMVSGSFPAAWQGRALELKGDIAATRGKTADARDAYSAALDLVEGGADRKRVQMKLDNLD